MLTAIIFLTIGLFVGAAFPITLNRVRRKLLSGKMFGKLPEDAKDPTRP